MKFVQLNKPVNIQNYYQFAIITPSRYSPMEYDVYNPQKYFSIVRSGTFNIIGDV